MSPLPPSLRKRAKVLTHTETVMTNWAHHCVHSGRKSRRAYGWCDSTGSKAFKQATAGEGAPRITGQGLFCKQGLGLHPTCHQHSCTQRPPLRSNGQGSLLGQMASTVSRPRGNQTVPAVIVLQLFCRLEIFQKVFIFPFFSSGNHRGKQDCAGLKAFKSPCLRLGFRQLIFSSLVLNLSVSLASLLPSFCNYRFQILRGSLLCYKNIFSFVVPYLLTSWWS